MRAIILVILATFTLSGCELFGPKKPTPTTVTTVNKAVPSCPAPPEVPQFTYRVDTLTPEDAATPGKVVKAYVYDMTFLRAQVKIYQSILDQYNQTTQDFSLVKQSIDQFQPAGK